MTPGRLDAFLAAERRQLPLWLPVLAAAGIALYFAPAGEPPVWSAAAALAAALLLLAALRRRGEAAPVVAAGLLALALGYAVALARAHLVAAPVLPGPVEARIEGRVTEISLTARGRTRLLLDRLRIDGIAPAATPARVRVTLRAGEGAALGPGDRVAVLAALSPPAPPAEPGGFDFRRHAWFDRLGGIGLARGPVAVLGPDPPRGPADRLGLAVAELRTRISRALRAALPGETGGFAAAILVGDQSALAAPAREALRASNLAHLLSISGLHMGLLTGLVYAAARLLLALVPPLALRWPIRKWAAVAAILAGAAYLALSGAAVPAQRSFVMVAVFFGALLADRAAVSLRSVAVAAAVVLALAPESLMEAGFQMSFAATIALVAAWEALGTRLAPEPGAGLFRRLARGAGGLALASLVAGTATAPFAAHAFNQAATWGLLANLLAVPLMGSWIMPAAVLAALAAPFGLEGPFLAAMGAGIDLVMAVAHWVAGFPLALRRVAEPAAPVLAPLALGGLWLCLWRGRVRLLGLAGILGGLLWWAAAVDRPALLVAASGRQAGLLGPEGRALLAPAQESFAAEEWLRADGDLPDAAAAARRPGLLRGRDLAEGRIGAWRVALVTAPRPGRARMAELCREKVLLVAPGLARPPPGPCLAFTGPLLRAKGPLAVWPEGEGLRAEPVRGPGPGRLWERAGRRAESDG